MRYIIVIITSVILHTSATATLKWGPSLVPSIISVKLEFVGTKAKYLMFVTKLTRNFEGYENTQK
jgi:hypothetical protein